MAAEILKNFESRLESLTLLPSDGGRFEVTVNGNLIYSKLSNGRFPRPGEVEDLIRKL
ncbi:MAG: SelT/SelW/SelH family protein [Anaerolineaceae bacterium]|nr:SelT/SelW/SelH family protein [Anaerolineaceae bacterium]